MLVGCDDLSFRPLLSLLMWYDVNETLSHNKLLNFVVGQRGVGKTYSCKRKVIQSFLRNGAQFVYLRRYDTELKYSQIEHFFSDIEHEFEGHEFQVKKGGVFTCDDMTMGWAISLSKAAQYKSVPFPKVDWIIFDEFIIDQGLIRYLPNEVETFNEMYSTIARLRDVKVLFLSNAITFTNPYFLYFDLRIPPNAVFYKRGDILVHYVANPEYIEAAQSTRFGQIIQETNYGKYAIENQFLRDSDAYIRSLPPFSKCIGVIKIEGKDVGIFETKFGSYYLSSKYDSTCSVKINMDKAVDSEDYQAKNGVWGAAVLKIVLRAYFSNNLYFTDITAKNLAVRRLLGGV